MKQWNMTEWHNPSKHMVTLRIFVQPGNEQIHRIPPGGRTVLSEEYDEAIRTTRDGVVVGGQCPWLVKGSEVSTGGYGGPAEAPPRVASALTQLEAPELVQAPIAPEPEPVAPAVAPSPAHLPAIEPYVPPTEPATAPKKK